MQDVNVALAQANDALAAGAKADIIRVRQEVVQSGDAAEYRGLRTRTQIMTNHQLTGADRLALYKEPGWHGLGEVIAEELTGEQAVDRFLGWKVVQEPVYTKIAGAERLLPLKANVRSDTRDLLGVVGPDYVVVQNHDIGGFADALLAEAKAEGVKVRMETCGSLLGGRKVFLTLRPDRDVRVGKTGADVTVPLLTIINGHDGTVAMTAGWTFVRVVSNNTYTSALGVLDQDVTAGRAFRIRHQGKVSDYLNSAKACLGLAVKGLEKFQEAAVAMGRREMGWNEVMAFFREAYQAQYGRVSDSPETEAEVKAEERMIQVVSEWDALMASDNQRLDGIGGTLWAAFNTITQWQDHTRAVKGVKSADRQQHLKLLGQGAVDKRKAFRAAMSVLAV
jgi:phage/plasmid-like protein (TIGR03299 family)